MKLLTKITISVLTSLAITACGGGSDGDSSDSNLEQLNGSASSSESVTKDGTIKVYYKKRTDTTVVAETKVTSSEGIKKITLYCIDAFKYYEENKLIIIGKFSKNYDPNKTKLEFFQYTFKNLAPQKSYILKAVAETKSGTLAQQTTMATLPTKIIKEALDLGPYSVAHLTRSRYEFNLNSPTRVSSIRIKEYDGDGELFDVYLKDINGVETKIADNVVSSGNNVEKTHNIASSVDKKILSVIIVPHGNAGGVWQFNSIVVNP